MREVDRRSKYSRRIFLQGAAAAAPVVAVATGAAAAAPFRKIRRLYLLRRSTSLMSFLP